VAVRREALRLAARAIERRLNDDRSDYVGSSVTCSCGEQARYVGHRPKVFRSVLDVLELWRGYFHCGACGQGFFPRDRQLGLENTSLSPAITHMIALVGATVSFAEGSELITQLSGVSVGAKMVERAAKRLGTEIAEDERLTTEPEAGGALPPTLYTAIDGTGVPMRAAELDGRSGKQPDGSAKTREAKVCIVWSAEARDKDGIPTRDPGSVTYTAAIETAASSDTSDETPPFAQRLLREMSRRRYFEADRRAFLGDGAAFIWNLADEHAPGAIQILDRFHAKEHLTEAAKAIWLPDGDNYRRWHAARDAELDAGDIERLVERLHVHSQRPADLPSCKAAGMCADYFDRNREKMRYAKFQTEGLCTATGVLEAACKTVIGTRLKRPGMHWSLAGANAIIALRCAKLSNRLEPFYQRRSALQQAA
jgi:hypothetical protein